MNTELGMVVTALITAVQGTYSMQVNGDDGSVDQVPNSRFNEDTFVCIDTLKPQQGILIHRFLLSRTKATIFSTQTFEMVEIQRGAKMVSSLRVKTSLAM
jgi:hypothetical protein